MNQTCRLVLLRVAPFVWEAAVICLVAALIAAPCLASEALPADGATDAGAAIYRTGMLPSGHPLEATREGGARVSGAEAACSNCHRRSGLGAREGRILIPPVTGKYLFTPPAGYGDLPYVEGVRANREPYTEETAARAIRDGIGPDGRPLSYLMPRFILGDSDMKSLIGYLRTLDRPAQAGATDTVLHFATVITPDADPVKRQGMLAVLKQFFTDKNAFPLGPTPRLKASRKEMFMVNRLWQLHVWQLSGPADTWGDQLKKHYAREPVLAVLSGLGGKNWAPVHAFCERQHVPCLFPNVDAPPDGADHDFYSLYFSRGVTLEAGLIANKILDAGNGDMPKRVQQIYRAGDIGAAGASALAAALQARGVKVQTVVLPEGKPGRGLAKALHGAASADALVMWLRPQDIASLGKMPASPRAVFMSGLMGGLERAPLPQSWRARTRLAYPFALQEERRVNVDFAFGWFAIRHVPLVAEQVQADTFLACSLLAETLHHMADTFVPDYLVERFEDMTDQRLITGYYPRLTLAPGQRFASKGGYIVHFSGLAGPLLAADGGWVIPR